MTETEQTGLTTSDIAGTTTDRDSRDERSVEQPASDAERAEPLLPADQTDRFRQSWEEIQRDFVDRPRESVEQADALVADLMQRLAAASRTSGRDSRASGRAATTSRRRTSASR